MEFRVVSEELKGKLKNCNGPEDVLALAKEYGYELADEQLESISGGEWGDETPVVKCPSCGKTFENPHHYVTMSCPHCGVCIGLA